jgi:hypothetical protein
VVSESDLSPLVFKRAKLGKITSSHVQKAEKRPEKITYLSDSPRLFFYCVYLGVLFPSKMADSGKMLEAAPHSRVVPVQTPAQSKPKQLHYPFWFGGSASCFAASVTHPLDLGTFSVIHSIMYYMLTRPQLR